jgi:quercetin dioxygenase-like cupin family protein
MKLSTGLVALAILGVSLVAAKPPDAPKDPRMVAKTLLQTVLAEEFTPNREVLVDLVEIAPNTTLDRHWHPGEEFHYYLEGDVEIRIDGEPAIIGKPGTVGHVPFKKLHTVVAGSKGAKLLVFRIHKQGEPMRYLEKEDGGKQ